VYYDYVLYNTKVNQSFISYNNRGKNTENTISTNGRYNQAETALIE